MLNGWVVNIAFPTLARRAMHGFPIAPDHALSSGIMVANFAVAASIAFLAVRMGSFSRKLAGSLALGGELANTAFVGVPLIHALGAKTRFHQPWWSINSDRRLPPAQAPRRSPCNIGGKPIAVRALVVRALVFSPTIALILAFATKPISYTRTR